MYQNNFLDFSQSITLYNIYDKIGSPGSELEMALIGGMKDIDWLEGCYTEETTLLPGINGLNKYLRYDYGLVLKGENKVGLRLEGNGTQHFWKYQMDFEKFREQQFNFYQKQMASNVPSVNINMCIYGKGPDRNDLRRKSYIKLVESGILEKSLKMAKTFNQIMNITICNDLILKPDKCGIEEVDNYIMNMLSRPNYKIKM